MVVLVKRHVAAGEAVIEILIDHLVRFTVHHSRFSSLSKMLATPPV
jgi:hypothetical protein